MTTRTLTVTDHLLEAQSILDKDESAPTVGPDEIRRALDCIERALTTLNLRRCEAAAALDQL